MSFLSIFKGKEKKLGYFILVDWNNKAKELGIGYDFMKEIQHYYNGHLYETEPYTPERLGRYKEDRVFIKDLTIGQMVPEESQFVNKNPLILGNIQIHKVVRKRPWLL